MPSGDVPGGVSAIAAIQADTKTNTETSKNKENFLIVSPLFNIKSENKTCYTRVSSNFNINIAAGRQYAYRPI